VLYCQDFARKLFEIKTHFALCALVIAQTRMFTDDSQYRGWEGDTAYKPFGVQESAHSTQSQSSRS